MTNTTSVICTGKRLVIFKFTFDIVNTNDNGYHLSSIKIYFIWQFIMFHIQTRKYLKGKMPSLLAISITFSLSSFSVIAQQTPNAEEQSIEKLTVYGRLNSLILESGTATKSNMQLIQTPAAVVVVDSTLFNEQSAVTLQESLRNVSGLTQAGNNYGIGDNLSIRGLDVNYTYDGIYGGANLGNNYNPTRSMTNIESIEVLKGPATGLYGIGAAGGVINLIEKKPQQEEAYSVRTVIGQWANYGLMLDATGGINDNSAYRIVANYETSDGYRGLSSERTELYGSVSLDVSQDNQFLFSAALIDDSVQVDSIGHPVRILSLDDISVSPANISAADLPNDSDSDGDNVFGIQLSNEQRQELANSVLASDGSEPFDLGSQGLISPLSRPNDGTEVRVKLRHDISFTDDFKLTQQLQYRDYSSKFVRQTGAFNYVYWNRNGEINANPRAPLVVDDTLFPYAARRQEYRSQLADEKMWQYFIDLTNTWSLGSVSGEHLLSANYESREASVQSYSIYDADGGGSLPYILDIRNPNFPTGQFEDYDPSLRSNYDKSVSAWGISAQEVVYFSDALTARIGAAYTVIDQDYQHKGTDRAPGVGEELDTDDSGFTYNLGLNYQFSEQTAAFLNYSKGQTAYSILGSLDSQGDDRPNSESISIDLGFRMTAFDENLLASFVIFETSRTNLRYGNDEYDDNPDSPTFNIDVPQYFFDQEDRSKGAEIDLNFNLNENWLMNFNATYQDAITIQGNDFSGQSKGVPLKFARIWTSYEQKFDGLAAPVIFSLGVSYEDERTVNSSAFGLPYASLPSYSVWDAAISYRLEDWDLQLNLRNLTDETYYSRAMFLGGLPAESRNAKLTAHYHF